MLEQVVWRGRGVFLVSSSLFMLVALICSIYLLSGVTSRKKLSSHACQLSAKKRQKSFINMALSSLVSGKKNFFLDLLIYPLGGRSRRLHQLLLHTPMDVMESCSCCWR